MLFLASFTRSPSVLTDRSSQDFLDRPSALEAIKQTVRTDPDFSRPIREGLRSTLKFNDVAAPSIAALFLWCDPFTIARLIISVIVNSFYRMLLRWARPHISKEILKRFKPSITDFNASCSVVVVSSRGQLIASLAHSPITSIFTFPNAPMLGGDHRHDFLLQAATRATGAINQAPREHRFNGATIAFAEPTLRSVWSNQSPAIKAHAPFESSRFH